MQLPHGLEELLGMPSVLVVLVVPLVLVVLFTLVVPLVLVVLFTLVVPLALVVLFTLVAPLALMVLFTLVVLLAIAAVTPTHVATLAGPVADHAKQRVFAPRALLFIQTTRSEGFDHPHHPLVARAPIITPLGSRPLGSIRVAAVAVALGRREDSEDTASEDEADEVAGHWGHSVAEKSEDLGASEASLSAAAPRQERRVYLGDARRVADSYAHHQRAAKRPQQRKSRPTRVVDV